MISPIPSIFLNDLPKSLLDNALMPNIGKDIPAITTAIILAIGINSNAGRNTIACAVGVINSSPKKNMPTLPSFFIYN